MPTDTMPPASASADGKAWMHKHGEALAWLLALVCLLAIPCRIIQIGYSPRDDALRHAAHAVDGRDWPEVLVMRPEFALDASPGWHAVLRALHQSLGWNTDALLCFSVAAMATVFLMAGLLVARSPAAWLVALLVGYLFSPSLAERLMAGRPYLAASAILLLLLGLWSNQDMAPRFPAKRILLAVALMTLAVWLHGSWYLFILLPVAFLLAGRLKSACFLAVCWLCGSWLGASLTGHPMAFLWQHVAWAAAAFGRHGLQRMLVSEFQPAYSSNLLVAMALFLLWARLGRRQCWRTILADPVFILAVLASLLSMRVSRFWADWGRPAAILWMALQTREMLRESLARRPGAQVVWTLFAGVALFLAITADVGGRWTSMLTEEAPQADDPSLAEWMPGRGGLLYSDDMTVFYRVYHANPHGAWRYVLGFEPGLMPDEDMLVYRSIQQHEGRAYAYAPWVEKMRPQDRLLLIRAAHPGIPGLEWKPVCRDMWIGRLPKPAD